MIKDRIEAQSRTERPIVGGDGLLEVDEQSVYRLREEILGANAAERTTTVGKYEDVAYEQPNNIREMFQTLQGYDDILESERRETVSRLMSGVVLKNFFKAESKDVYNILEFTRDRLMYGRSESDSRPWHWMRGRALALETIVNAPLLRVEGEQGTGEFDTMSAELNEDLLDTIFDDRAPSLRGLSISDAVLDTERKFYGKDIDAARARTKEKLDRVRTFLNAPVTHKFKDIVLNCTDSLGIRSRGAEVTAAILQHLESKGQLHGRELTMMSFGCGTARSVLSVAKDMSEKGVASKVVLLDQDPIALAAAMQLADNMGVGDSIEVHCEKLFDRFGRPLDLDRILDGRRLDVAEDSGLREYLPDSIYINLAKQTWNFLKNGGITSTGNMNSNRPQGRFLEGMMGWYPSVKMRQIEDNFRLLERAGIPAQSTKCTVTKDGVYSLFSSVKP